MKILVPPIKSQGIKTKLVPWIKSMVSEDFEGTWIEPFMGTGVVAFNIMPKKAILGDSNPHLINLYKKIQILEITGDLAQKYLEKEGSKLLENGESHFYYVRDRFNEENNPLDFIFINRAGFNGMIRFNKKGKSNVPFCRKPNRFDKSYITRIVNQINSISKVIKLGDYEFINQNFQETIKLAQASDTIYCDPPYIDRHADYFNQWQEIDEILLSEELSKCKSQFILSTWHHNNFRKNTYIETIWDKYNIVTKDHFYHVGGKETNRNPMVEALVTNIALPNSDANRNNEYVQLEFNLAKHIAA